MNKFEEGDEVRIIKKVEPPNWDGHGEMRKLMKNKTIGKVGKHGSWSGVEFPDHL